ncbi:PIN-like domain-containing protein [Amycolatopsis japonica]|uniref:PIN-like domain-containing protein n=1 Tax=Amycolatopsis japonica TaxID=208439 RepID=UPI0036729520
MGEDPHYLTPDGFSTGFEGYLNPSDMDYRAVLTSGMVVLDTNVLLNLYRFDDDARNDLLAVLERLQGNVWIPHQALEEFWRNREQTILSRSSIRRDSLESLKKPIRALESAMDTWARNVGLSRERLSDLLALIHKTHDTLNNAIEGPTTRDPLAGARDTNMDPVLASLHPLLAGRVGTALPNEDFVAALAEAKRRADEQIPPGYMDRDKPDNRGPGDYLVWEQTLREASRRSADVLLVTSDVKEDWWRRIRGAPVGPRVELVDELRARVGTRLFMLQPQQLLGLAGRLLDVEVRPGSASQIASTTAIVTPGRGSGEEGHVRLYLTSALEGALSPTVDVKASTGTGESTWDVSLVASDGSMALVWIYDPVKPFNDLATGSVLSTARSMVASIRGMSSQPRIACVVDLANLMNRMRLDEEPWARTNDGELMAKVFATFQPHVDELSQVGFDAVQVIAGVDQAAPEAAEAFQRIDQVVETVTLWFRPAAG